MSDSERTALLLVAHGSRRAEANADLVKIAALVRERAAFDVVEIGYLELAEPSIPDGLRACAAAGAARVVVAPYFLSAGSHVQDDLERFRREIAEEHPEVDFAVGPPLGVHPLMVDIVLDRLDEIPG